ncbi:MAG: cupin domain-containing protein [Clostridiales bacterium]|nr:cupin domain-containing protein [Clostridiales bacterium]
MKNNKEPLEYHLEFLSDDWEQPHLHQEAELIYVLEGSATVLDGETTHHLGEEDVFLVNRNRKHALSVGERALVFQVFLSPRLFQQYLEQNHPFFRCDSASGGNEDYNSLRLHLRRLMNRFVNHPDSPDFQVTLASLSSTCAVRIILVCFIIVLLYVKNLVFIDKHNTSIDQHSRIFMFVNWFLSFYDNFTIIR